MTNPTLDRLLFPYDTVEQKQVIDGVNINDLNINFLPYHIPKIPENLFFNENDIFINKHHRFSYMPTHTHNFVEFNYMYSGSCTQRINNETITLNKNDLIMMDKDIKQSIDYTGSEDVLVNILVKDHSLSHSLFNSFLHSTNLVTQFLMNASRMDAIHDNFIVFKLEKNDLAINLIESLIMKGLANEPNKKQALNMLLSLLLPELSNSIEREVHSFNDTEEAEFLPILNYIDENYQNISLQKVANQFGYNSNYLGNKLKQKTGQSFQELLDDKRLAIAKELLLETKEPIEQISQFIGFTSSPSLFRLFKKKMNQSPTMFRKEHKNQRIF